MTVIELLIQLRDDLKLWTENNLNAINDKIDNNTIPIDDALNAASTNPIQNKVVADIINNLNQKIGLLTVQEQIQTAIDAQYHFSGNYNDLSDAPTITDNNSDTLIITDSSGNIIVQIDENGVSSIDFYIDNASIKDKIHMWDSKSGFSGDYNDLFNQPMIAEDESNEFLITDLSGNILARFNENGFEVKNIISKNILLDSEDLKLKLNNLYTTLNNFDYSTLRNAPNIREDESGKYRIIDEAGNIIFLVDQNGISTTEIAATGMCLDGINLNEQISNLITRINNLENKITYGTKDLVAGTSKLATGTIYCVYE